MKKIILLLLLATTNTIVAQNIAFEQVGLKVENGKAGFVFDLLNDFYGSIEKPDGVNISLNRIYFKPEEVEATHFLTFSGSVEGLTALRELRSGAEYLAFNDNILKFADLVSVTGGSTLMRMNVEKANENVFQVWKWRVEDAPSFAGAFTDLIKAFPQQGYLSLGQFSHGTSSDGESHYVYTTHKDYGAALAWGPKLKLNKKHLSNFKN